MSAIFSASVGSRLRVPPPTPLGAPRSRLGSGPKSRRALSASRRLRLATSALRGLAGAALVALERLLEDGVLLELLLNEVTSSIRESCSSLIACCSCGVITSCWLSRDLLLELECHGPGPLPELEVLPEVDLAHLWIGGDLLGGSFSNDECPSLMMYA